MLTRVATLAVAMALVVACAQSEDSSATTGTTTPTSAPSASSVTTRSTATTPETTEVSVPDTPYLEGLDLETIDLDDPAGDARPILSWAGLDEAVMYTVLVLDPDGAPWWAWSGSETQVVLGGVETTAEVGGPRATTGVSWIVFAFDSDGALIGASPRSELGI